jgi:maltose alpha-D-glucosyltransferase/alpha-amylase
VTDEERDYMYQAYAADPRMRINVGIRRRLAPLVENSRRRIELLNSLLFSLPGTPVIYYGDEIGMGDNIFLGDRNGVRTPMQWTSDRNAGFSRTDPAQLYAPPIMDPVYGYQAINVEAQERSPFSLLNWMKRLIALRKQFRVFGRGTLEFLPAPNRKILAYVRAFEDETVLCVANLSRTVQPVELDLSRFKGMTPVEMLGLTEFPRIGELPYFLTLPGYNSYWFRLQAQPSPIAAQRIGEPDAASSDVAAALPAFFMGVAWDTLLDGNVRTLIERESLVPFLQRQRWFGAKARAIRAARFIDWGPLRRGPDPMFATIVEIDYQDGGRERYFVPLTTITGAQLNAVLTESPHLALARLTGARKGAVVDAAVDDRFGALLMDTFDHLGTVRLKRGILRTRKTTAYEALRGEGSVQARRLGGEQSNTTLAFGDRLAIKLFRRIDDGPNPDVEIGEHLTTHTAFRRSPQLAAWAEYEGPGEAIAHVIVAQQFLPSQANGWNHALGELDRFVEEVQVQPAPGPDLLGPEPITDLAAAATPQAMCELTGAYIDSAHLLGRRTAELHLALASDTRTAPFAPEPFGRDDYARLLADALGQGREAAARLQSGHVALPADAAADAIRIVEQTVLDLRARHEAHTAQPFAVTASRTRIHGDYHLGQVLWSEGDFYILDFEGEPARPLSERRQKESPLKDVAGMLRSFSYAAYAALLNRSAGRAGDVDRLEPWAQTWARWTGAAFLKGYFAAAGDAPFIPADRVQRAALLDLFLIDKALYELNYELNNRPDWVRIPLRGLTDLITASRQ